MALPMELLREINMELHNVVFSNQTSLNKLQPLPVFIPLPSALPSGFLGQDTGRQQLNTVTASHRLLEKCLCFWCSGISDPHRFRNLEPLQYHMLTCVNTTHCKADKFQQWRWDWMAWLRGSCCGQSNYLQYIIQYYFWAFGHFVTGNRMVKSLQVKQCVKYTPGKKLFSKLKWLFISFSNQKGQSANGDKENTTYHLT